MKNNGRYRPDIEIVEFQLQNGLKVVMSRNDRIPMISVNTTFHVGSKDEEEGKTGLAHLFEHLMFEGSPNVPKGKFDEILNQNGGDSNAYTSWDATSYYMVLPSSLLETALWLDSDRIAGFDIDEENMEIQKKVVYQEKLQVHDNTPYGSLEEESSKRLFRKSGYRYPIIGAEEHILGFQLQDLKKFYDIYYKPDNCVISIAGDIDYAKTETLITKYYGDIQQSGKKIIRNYDEDEIECEIKGNIYDNVQFPGRFLFYRIHPEGTKEYYALKLLSGILAHGESSKLYNRLIYDKKIAKESTSYVFGMENVSLFVIDSIMINNSKLKKVSTEIDLIIEELRNDISESDIDKIKNAIETYNNLKLQTIVSVSERLSHYKTFYNECSLINDEIERYLEISRTDIYDAMNKYILNNKRVALNYLPKEKI